MIHSSDSRLSLVRLVRRAASRWAAVASGHARAAFRHRAAVAVAALVLAGPAAVAQGPVPQGPEFRVNTTTTGFQQYPSVAQDADGDFVVVWYSDQAQPGIYARQYTASGMPVGPEFPVATGGIFPSVAVDADGDFVVTWFGLGLVGDDGSEVYARRYAASGTPAGPEFRVNTTTTGDQNFPSVAVAADGDFVVAWRSAQGGLQPPPPDIYARRYAASGTPVGGQFRVNTNTTTSKYDPSVAVDADGDFVVTWESFGQDGDDSGIYAQRYAGSGEPVGPEFRVNTTTTSSQRDGQVAMDADGDFVVVWWGNRVQDGPDRSDIYAQRYAASGAAVGPEFQVNTDTTGARSVPSVAVDADGDFVVAWSGSGRGDTSGVHAQRYAASGEPVGSEFRVNTFTDFNQQRPDVAVDADGDLVVVWESFFQKGTSLGSGVYAQRYAAPTVTSEPAPASGLTLALVPNPAGTAADVRYETPVAGRVRVTVSDVLGRQVAVLVDGEQSAGPHSVALDAGRLAPGVYVVRLEAGAATVVRRVTVAR